jgi:hypothetical protein
MAKLIVSEFVTRDVNEVSGLKEEDAGPIVVAGSRTLVHGLMVHSYSTQGSPA